MIALIRSRHSYVDYYRCVNAKGEDFVPCKQFFRAYNSLCPNEWVSIFSAMSRTRNTGGAMMDSKRRAMAIQPATYICNKRIDTLLNFQFKDRQRALLPAGPAADRQHTNTWTSHSILAIHCRLAEHYKPAWKRKYILKA